MIYTVIQKNANKFPRQFIPDLGVLCAFVEEQVNTLLFFLCALLKG